MKFSILLFSIQIYNTNNRVYLIMSFHLIYFYYFVKKFIEELKSVKQCE
jgi:hypothetical protein